MVGNKWKVLFFGLVIANVLLATTPLGSLQTALETLCSDIESIVPIVAFIMILAAGVIYAVGQLMGAETRARASVWATAMFVGAIIGILIVVITPKVLGSIYGSEFSCSP